MKSNLLLSEPRGIKLKAIYDSCYVPPEQRSTVIKDNDPVKMAAYREAL